MIGASCLRRWAFTLIELLVVVAIIALLISILLPSLRDAREQAKVAKCLAHYRQLTTATIQYLMEHNDNYPFYDPPSNKGPCSWSYGGKTCADYWRTRDGGRFFFEVTQRPFNKYLVGTELPNDVYEGSTIAKRAEVPVLSCPSDRYSHQQHFWQPNPGESPISCYDDVGTSYHYNLHAMFDVDWNGDRDPWTKPGDWQEIGQLLVRQTLAKYSSTYLMYLPDPLDWGLHDQNIDGRPDVGMTIGNHGKFGKHALGFLDGHSAYMFVDSRAWCGPGWQAINPEWIRRYGHVPRPAHYFLWNTKNCEPPR